MHKIVISAVFSYFTTVRAASHTASNLAEHLLLLDLVVAVSAHVRCSGITGLVMLE